MRYLLRTVGITVMLALVGCTTGAPPTTVVGWAETMDALDGDQQDMSARSSDVLACGDGTASSAQCAELVALARAFGQRTGDVLPAGDPPEEIEPTVTRTRQVVDQIATRADVYETACPGGNGEECDLLFIEVFASMLQLLSILDAYDRATQTDRPTRGSSG